MRFAIQPFGLLGRLEDKRPSEPSSQTGRHTAGDPNRLTVGTTVVATNRIYNYLRLLFAKIGVPHCPQCGREIRREACAVTRATLSAKWS